MRAEAPRWPSWSQRRLLPTLTFDRLSELLLVGLIKGHHLTSHPLSLPWYKAVLINFVVGLTCIVGGRVMTAADISEPALGLILAAGAGSYVYVGATISLPAAMAGAYKAAGLEHDNHGHHGHSKGNLQAAKHLMLMLLSCIVGATAIGLILIKHEHCVPEGQKGGGHHHHRRRF